MTASTKENPRYLTEQLITYIGNKRALLPFIAKGLDRAQKKLGPGKMTTFDVFSGSGIVSRFLKQYSTCLIANDLEAYARVINQCYLSNRADRNETELTEVWRTITARLETEKLEHGLIADLYAPKDDADIQQGERVFYTGRNAHYLDTARHLICEQPEKLQPFLLAPLLAEASVHANTSGVFKGFYKNSHTGIGQFGGRKEDALSRIRGDIVLPYPVFSEFDCETEILSGDANAIADSVRDVDVAYLDPPYNQHPYGSNYFMLNLLVNYRKPDAVSPVSGIPPDWNRSLYNKKRFAAETFAELVEKLRAKFLIVSFNSEGFISTEEMTEILSRHGKLEILETAYNTFRGCRNLDGRGKHVTEYLYLLEKK